MNRKALAVILAAAGIAVVSPAHAAGSLKIGFVDMRQVILESKAGKVHQAEMEKLINERQGPLDQEKKKLQALRADFLKERLTLTDAQKAAKQKQFQAELQKYQAMAGEAQNALRAKDNQFMQQSIGLIKTIIAKVARTDHLGLVFEKSQLLVLYSKPGMDITQQVMQQYNARGLPAAK